MFSLNRDKIQRMVGPSRGGSGGGGGFSSGDLAGYASQLWVQENFLSIEFFSNIFKTYGPGENEGDPDVEVIPNDTESTIDNIKAMFGFWTDQYISALGQNSGGGGGGGATSLAELTDVQLTNLSNGQALVYNATAHRWENHNIGGGGGGGGTLTSIGLVMPTGFSVNPGTLTSDGFFTVSFLNGYSLPLTADVAKGVSAYGWGDHSQAGYALASNVYSKTDADARFLKIDFFRALFRAYKANGTTEVVPNTGDTSLIDSIKAMFGFWTNQYLTALGQGSGGSGGGTLAGLTDVTLTSPTVGQILKYNGTHWINADDTIGSVTSITVGSTSYSPVNGVVTLPGYLQLSGGTMTGALGASTAGSAYNTSRGINFGDVSHIGTSSSSFGIYCTHTIYLRPNSTLNESGQTNGIVLSSTAFTYNGNDVYHAGNLNLSNYMLKTDVIDIAHGGTGGTSAFAGISNLGGLSLASIGENIPDYSDINTYTNGGTYYSGSSTHTGTMSNTPVTSAGFKLIVMKAYSSARIIQFAVSSPSVGLKWRTSTDTGSTWGDWKTFAFTDSTIAKAEVATKLETARSLWGQSFDGSADVTGDITVGNGDIYLNNNKHIYFKSTGGNDMEMMRLSSSDNLMIGYGLRSTSNAATYIHGGTGGIQLRTNGTTSRLTIDSDGNIGIGTGTTALTHKMEVNGTFDVSGATTLASTLGVTGSTTLSSTLSVGDTATMRSIIPNSTATYDIGSSSKYFNYTYTKRLYLASGVYLEYDSTNAAVQVVGAGLYTNSYISALGVSSGSGGGGVTLNQPLSGINGAGLGVPSTSGQALVYNGSAWTYSGSTTLKANAMSVSTSLSAYTGSFGSSLDVTAQLTIAAGDLVVTNGSAGIGGSSSSTYKLYVHGLTRSNDLALGEASTISTITYASIKSLNSRGLYIESSNNAPIYVNCGTGSLWSNKNWSTYSDIRYKTKVSDAEATVDAIAEAPVFNYWWDDENDIMLGSSAQYWKDVFGYAVKGGDDTIMSMDYSAIALAAAVITARKVVDHEERIAALERENEELRAEIVNLKAH